ncbi:hypothetical protein EYZ11_009568 [Aspergillus tanneri]|uniref:Uncharacterized protein n=1 Tax=Aspergillus tanneri TaxID=1220188 RepID=A0A4S3J7R3_9EURO|nr:uncharacterized protein ATNIH1004_008725 [Aspergillus tanneri]KAA8644521.1 hypothetical protein ATNIH1004_008725 [Aspergillus tanneri]THC90960.1 hypothetical protein EYZ11_009568 [Aspergillus tanneri]
MPGVPPNALRQLKEELKSIFRRKKKAAKSISESTPAADKPAGSTTAPTTEAKPDESAATAEPRTDKPAENTAAESSEPKPEGSEEAKDIPGADSAADISSPETKADAAVRGDKDRACRPDGKAS